MKVGDTFDYSLVAFPGETFGINTSIVRGKYRFMIKSVRRVRITDYVVKIEGKCEIIFIFEETVDNVSTR